MLFGSGFIVVFVSLPKLKIITNQIESEDELS